MENEGFALLHGHVVIITSNSVIPRRRWAEYRHNAAARSFMLFQPPISLLCGVVADIVDNSVCFLCGIVAVSVIL